MSWNDMEKVNEKEKVSEKEKVEDKPKKEIKFSKLKDVVKKRGMKILSYGTFSTGKTHFALSGEGPVYLIDTENGASPLADKYPDANIIKISEMSEYDENEKDEVKNFESFQRIVDYLSKLDEDKVGTVIVDSISDIWELAQAYGKVKIFKLGVEDRLKQQWDWGIINKIYLNNLKKLINMNCDLVLTARESEVYEGAGKPSGTYAPKCQKKTPYWVDIVLFHRMKMINKQIVFSATIEKARQKGDVIGKVVMNPDIKKIKEQVKKNE